MTIDRSPAGWRTLRPRGERSSSDRRLPFSSSEAVWLAAVELEASQGEHERARLILDKARERANTERIWLKSVELERLLGREDLTAQALVAHARCAELHRCKAEAKLATAMRRWREPRGRGR